MVLDINQWKIENSLSRLNIPFFFIHDPNNYEKIC